LTKGSALRRYFLAGEGGDSNQYGFKYAGNSSRVMKSAGQRPSAQAGCIEFWAGNLKKILHSDIFHA
jgi:hypothetical protein